MADPDIMKAQQQLICRGYLPDGADDGILGPQTVHAIIAYQTDRSTGHVWAFTFPLAIDGIIGRHTRFRLEPRQIQRGDTGDHVKLCQEILTWLADHTGHPNYDPKGIDSDFGPNTEAAVKAFQKDHKDHEGNPLKVDGIVGVRTWCALRS
jgi:peptidoglycan hydrolase-like protein with peptidoglycan-binding domain